MKKLLIALLLLNLSCAPRIAVKRPTLYKDAWQEKEIAIPKVQAESFLNEKYTYKVKWLGLTVGWVSLENLGIQEYKGKKAYHIVIRARTNRFLDRLFKVKDEFHSYLEVDTLKPLLFKSKRREGGYRFESELIFDYAKGKILYHSLLDNCRKELKLEEGLLDIISCFYRFRTLSIDKPKYKFLIVHRSKIWEVNIKVIKKGLLEMRKRGLIKALLININAQHGKEKAKGEAWVWFSADEKKIPLLVQVNVDIPIVGTVVAALD
jgi:hypothetical protein